MTSITDSGGLLPVAPEVAARETNGAHPSNGNGGADETKPPRWTSQEWQEADVNWLRETRQIVLRRGENGTAVMSVGRDGIWDVMPEGIQSMARAAAIASLSAAPHRSAAWDEITGGGKPATARHYEQVVRKSKDESTELEWRRDTEFNDSQGGRNTVIPVVCSIGCPAGTRCNHGGAFRLREASFIHAAELRDYFLSARFRMELPELPPASLDELEAAASALPPDPGLEVVRSMLRPGSPLFSLGLAIAWSIGNIQKGITIFRWDETNTGKSTLAELAELATGGAVAHANSVKSLSMRTGGFTPAFKPLARSLCYIVDEADEGKLAWISPSDLEAFVAVKAWISEKYIEPGWERRTAGGILICNDWPSLPFGTRGLIGTDTVPGRGDYAPIRIEDEAAARKYFRHEHDAAVSSAAALWYVRSWLLIAAGDFLRLPPHIDSFREAVSAAFNHEATVARIDAGRTEIRERHEDALETASGDDYTVLCRELEYTGAPSDLVFHSTLAERLGLEKLPRDFKEQLRELPENSAIPERAYDSTSRKVDGKKKAALRGWRLIPTSLNLDDADELELEPDGGAPAEPEQPELAEVTGC